MSISVVTLLPAPAQTPAYYWGGINERCRSTHDGEEYMEYTRFYSDFRRGRVRVQPERNSRPDRDSDYFLEDKDDWADPEEWI